MKIVLFALAVAAAFAVPGVSAIEIDNPIGETSQWIVGFYVMPDIQPGDTYEGAEVISTTPQLNVITVATTDFALFNVRATLDENVQYVETDFSDHTLQYSPNDYFVAHSSNWGMNKIGLGTAWDVTLGSTAVKDGHIDSGRVIAHEDLSGSRWINGYDYKNNDATPDDNSGCSWHGSHTAGTVAATINNAKGFPGTAQITEYTVKIFGTSGNCLAASTTGIANAILSVGNAGAQISSNSWGGGAYSTTINNAINTARGQGVIFIVSAGNGGCSNCITAPWLQQEANVIIVTATDVNDAGASFNSKGPQTDVSAPGVGIGSAGGPGNSYYVMSGTSMACPYVAGVAGLIKTLNPTFTEAQVQARLKSTALDLGTPGEDDTFGAGRIRANLAVY